MQVFSFNLYSHWCKALWLWGTYFSVLLTVQVIVRIGHHQLLQTKRCFSITREMTTKMVSWLTELSMCQILVSEAHFGSIHILVWLGFENYIWHRSEEMDLQPIFLCLDSTNDITFIYGHTIIWSRQLAKVAAFLCGDSPRLGTLRINHVHLGLCVFQTLMCS